MPGRKELCSLFCSEAAPVEMCAGDFPGMDMDPAMTMVADDAA